MQQLIDELRSTYCRIPPPPLKLHFDVLRGLTGSQASTKQCVSCYSVANGLFSVAWTLLLLQLNGREKKQTYLTTRTRQEFSLTLKPQLQEIKELFAFQNSVYNNAYQHNYAVSWVFIIISYLITKETHFSLRVSYEYLGVFDHNCSCNIMTENFCQAKCTISCLDLNGLQSQLYLCTNKYSCKLGLGPTWSEWYFVDRLSQ